MRPARPRHGSTNIQAELSTLFICWYSLARRLGAGGNSGDYDWAVANVWDDVAETFACFLLRMHSKRRPVPDIKRGAVIARNTVLACRDPTLSRWVLFAHACPGSCPLWGGATTVASSRQLVAPLLAFPFGDSPSADASATN